MAKAARSSGDDQSPKRKPSAEDTAAVGLRVDLDIRVKGTGLIITRAQIAALIAALTAALAAIGWALTHFH